MATCNDCFHWGACQNMIQICNCKVFEVSEGAEECEHYKPTADVVEVKHGHWDDRENPRWRAYNIRHCSMCGWNIPKNNLRKKDMNWNYCPKCGAKMDGGKHD